MHNVRVATFDGSGAPAVMREAPKPRALGSTDGGSREETTRYGEKPERRKDSVAEQPRRDQ